MSQCYSALKQQVYEIDRFSIVPIRDEDKFLIMQIRNEQIYHLRQEKPLAKDEQTKYFSEVVSKLFEKDYPEQILFSYLHDDKCIGYGGLVHINWKDQHAEISFVIKTELEDSEFDLHWSNFLSMIEKVAFYNLSLHKIFTYAFDLRPHLYTTLLKNHFAFEAKLVQHCFFHNRFINVMIHSKFNNA
jgi:hypothetical protein